MTPPTPLHQSRRLGAWTIHAIQAGGQRLDGGAMFGVVPKTLWERRIPADARNRIRLGMRCLLVEHESGLVLVDTGAGNKEDSKFIDIYGIENAGTPTALEDGIRAAGFTPEQVTLVINTHLHFDHAGGNTMVDAEGQLKASFPNARYVVQRGEYEWAMRTNERTAASYFAHAPDAWTHAAPPVGAAHERRRDGLLLRRRGADRGAPAAALDHGLRRRAARHAREQALAARSRAEGGLARGLRARRERGVGTGGPRREELQAARGRLTGHRLPAPRPAGVDASAGHS